MGGDRSSVVRTDRNSKRHFCIGALGALSLKSPSAIRTLTRVRDGSTRRSTPAHWLRRRSSTGTRAVGADSVALLDRSIKGPDCKGAYHHPHHSEPPSDADIAKLLQKLSRRVIRTLRQLGYLEAGSDDTVATGYAPWAAKNPSTLAPWRLLSRSASLLASEPGRPGDTSARDLGLRSWR